ncbi:MAG TPA: hypothetical protein VMZ28_07860 [Kofleriaceae bacterium]|nr:hypothetical protein [Kofleriaceae bacterium]
MSSPREMQGSLLQGLLEAISQESVRAAVAGITERSVAAIHQLATVDEEVFTDSSVVATRVLRGTRALVEHLEAQGFEQAGSTDDTTSFDDFAFDLEEAPPADTGASIREEDILGAIEVLAARQRASAAERWNALRPQLAAFTYALGSQLRDFDQRHASALEEGRGIQALRELDDVGNALTDGIFALLGTICEAYLEDVDRDRLIPGHRSALGKALLVRRGLADLRRSINRSNAIIQHASAPREDRGAAFDALARALVDFIGGDVFPLMRPADRAELRAFAAELDGATVAAAATTCEGLDKYLDSLAVVNRRNVLMKHDADLLHDIAENLEGAIELASISPSAAGGMVRAAFTRAGALHGVRDALDALLLEWQEVHAGLEGAAFVPYARRLAELVRT